MSSSEEAVLLSSHDHAGHGVEDQEEGVVPVVQFEWKMIKSSAGAREDHCFPEWR